MNLVVSGYDQDGSEILMNALYIVSCVYRAPYCSVKMNSGVTHYFRYDEARRVYERVNAALSDIDVAKIGGMSHA